MTPKHQNSNIETFRPDTDCSKTNLKWQHFGVFQFLCCNQIISEQRNCRRKRKFIAYGTS